MGDYQKKKRKSPWRFVFQAMAVYGAVKLLGGICVNVLHLLTRTQMMLSDSQAYSVGIIGGADGPTAVFVTAPIWTSYIVPVVCLIAGLLGFWKLCKK